MRRRRVWQSARLHLEAPDNPILKLEVPKVKVDSLKVKLDPLLQQTGLEKRSFLSW
jgi:hypothetical protein